MRGSFYSIILVIVALTLLTNKSFARFDEYPYIYDNGIKIIRPYGSEETTRNENLSANNDTPCASFMSPDFEEKTDLDNLQPTYDSTTNIVTFTFWFTTNNRFCNFQLTKKDILLSENQIPIKDFTLDLVAINESSNFIFIGNPTPMLGSSAYNSFPSGLQYKISYKPPFSFQETPYIFLKVTGNGKTIETNNSYKKHWYSSLTGVFKNKIITKEHDNLSEVNEYQELKNVSWDVKTLLIDARDSSKVCFKSFIGVDHAVGEKDEKGQLKREYISAPFDVLLRNKNSMFNNTKPYAAINTDYLEGSGAPLSINVIQGIDYSGPRKWTSIAITKNNIISFVTEKPGDAYNVSGGGPRLFEKPLQYKAPTANALGAFAYFRSERSILLK